MDWQPIETAPLDGRELLIYDEHLGIVIGSYGKPEKMFVASDWNAYCCGCHPEKLDRPTHWMPLPEPPEGE